MPALPAVNQVLRILTQYKLGGDTDVLNRQFVSFTGIASTTNLDALAVEAGAAWTTHMKPLLNAYLTLESYTITDLTSATGVEVNYPIGAVGNVATSPLTAGVAMVIQSKILRRYRGGHPRLYLPGLSTADVGSPQTWIGSTVTNMETGWNAYIAAILTNAPAGLTIGTFQNVSYYQGFQAFEEPSGRYRNIPKLRAVPVQDAILSYAINTTIASQRRRNQQL